MTVIDSYHGRIPISYRMFVFEPQSVENVDIETIYGAGMLHAKREALGVSAATYSYPSIATLTIEIHDTRPDILDLSDWDAAAETSYRFKTAAYPKQTLDTDPQPLQDRLGAAVIPPGAYRVRAYGRIDGSERVERPQSRIDKDPEFDDDDNLITADTLEEFAVHFWLEDFDNDSLPVSTVIKENEEYVQW